MNPPGRRRTPFKPALKPPVLRHDGLSVTTGAGRGAQTALAAQDGGRLRGNFRTLPDAVRYFAEKANLPTATWRDLWQGQHARAFTVAGAMKGDLLADLRQAVDGAIRDGESLGKFRRRFDAIVAQHGWAHTGGRNWRSRVIYDTNIRTSFMAGKYAQLTDPDMLARHPYWEYRHYMLDNPRLEHKAWNGRILRHDDPWWRTHYPPNGWGCHCDVLPVSNRRLRELGKTGPDPAPDDLGEVPPEWQYNVGEAAWAQPVAAAALGQAGKYRWTDVPGPGPAAFGRPEVLPSTLAGMPLGHGMDADGIRALWAEQFGPQSILTDASGGRVVLTDRIVERWLTTPDQRRGGRERYLPLLRQLVERPAEIWTNWVVNEAGEYMLRRRLVSAIEAADGSMELVAIDATAGGIALDWVTGAQAAGLRQGQLVWGQP